MVRLSMEHLWVQESRGLHDKVEQLRDKLKELGHADEQHEPEVKPLTSCLAKLCPVRKHHSKST